MPPSLKKPLRPFCWGVLHAIGMFDPKEQLTDADREEDPAGYRTLFSLGEVFWALFLATAGLVLAQVLDPVTAERLAEILAGLMP